MNTVSLERKYNSCGIGTASAVPPIHNHILPSKFHQYNTGMGESTPAYKIPLPIPAPAAPTMSTSTYVTPAFKPIKTSSTRMTFPPKKGNPPLVSALPQGTPSTCSSSTTSGTQSEASVSTPLKNLHGRVIGLEPRAFVPRAVERDN